MLLHHFLTDSAARFPDKVALVCGSQRATYAELAADSDALAAAMTAAGLAHGDRVAVFLDNRPETVVALFAILKAGAAFMPVNPGTKAPKLIRLLTHSEAAFVVSDTPRAAMVAAAADELPDLKTVVIVGERPAANFAKLATLPYAEALQAPPDCLPRQIIDQDLAALIYTSGSTGMPKGVMHTHASLVSAFSSIVGYLGNTPHDVILSVLPLAFVYGLGQLFTIFKAGGRLVLENSMMYPQEVLNRIASEGATGVPFVPTIAALLLQTDLEQQELSSLRYLTNAGGPLPGAHVEELRRRLPHVELINMYGQTECIRASFLPGCEIDRRPLSVGRGIPNQEIYIVRADGSRAAAGETGQLVVRGSQLMHGYWKQPEETARKLKPGPLPGTRVLMTGDLFRADDDGYFYFVSRQDDIIKTRGEKVSPKEVEDAIYQLPSIAEAMVVGIPDPILGQAVMAAVVARAGCSVTEREVRQICARHVEEFMLPKVVQVRSCLPKTQSGKLRRKELVEQYIAQMQSDRPRPGTPRASEPSEGAAPEHEIHA